MCVSESQIFWFRKYLPTLETTWGKSCLLSAYQVSGNLCILFLQMFFWYTIGNAITSFVLIKIKRFKKKKNKKKKWKGDIKIMFETNRWK